MQDLGTLPGYRSSWATAINASGKVAGYATNVANGHTYAEAFLCSGGSLKDLGVPGASSYAYGVNASGQVVGAAYVDQDLRTEYAFIYSGGTVQNLNNLLPQGSGWTLQQANAINDVGQIVGFGIGPSGSPDAFLMTPVRSLVNGQWNQNGDGVWSSTANWTADGVPGGTAQDSAVFAAVLTSGTATATLNSSFALSSLGFSTTGANSYVIASTNGATLTLIGASGTAAISNSGGFHTIAAPLVLGSNVIVSESDGSGLLIDGGISGMGSLTLVGSGELALDGTNSYYGGTAVGGGTLTMLSAAALPSTGLVTIGAGGRLVLGGGSGIGALLTASQLDANGKAQYLPASGSADNALENGPGETPPTSDMISQGGAAGSPHDAAAVPEPGALALLAVAAVGLALVRRRYAAAARRRRA